MSGRSCSVPCAVLFARDLVAVKEAPQHAIAGQRCCVASAVLSSSSVISGVSSAWRSTRIERRSRQNRLRRGTRHPFHPPAADRARAAHSKTDRRLPTRQARQETLTCLRPPSRQTVAITRSPIVNPLRFKAMHHALEGEAQRVLLPFSFPNSKEVSCCGSGSFPPLS